MPASPTLSSSALRERTKLQNNINMIPLHSLATSTTLQTELKSSNKRNITDFTISIPSSAPSKSVVTDESPSRWRTLEFKFYAAAFVVVVPFMVWLPIRLSSPNHPNYSQYSHRLSPGWIFGWPVDNSDAQYRSFRSNLLPLVYLSIAYLNYFLALSIFVPSSTSTFKAHFILGFATLFIIILHGSSSLKILAILSLNYCVAKTPLKPALRIIWPAIIICGNMGILFLNERYDGYKFGDMHVVFATLDSFSGALPRWHIGFNITMLRMVSFSLDYLWRDTTTSNESPTEYRKRVSTSLAIDDYGYVNYLAYCLYPPLYIAGPIMTYNDFVWQLRVPVFIPLKTKISYALRFLFCILSMESVLHTMYVVAIKDTSAWNGDSPAELSMIGFWNLVVVWLKLLIPWRFFRLWALLDGMDPPENMVRCVANNYSTLGFWRSWHRSYNLWIVRYIYIPVGGANNAILSTALVFTFVALWHDLSFKLLAWGWLVSLFIVPELLARKTFSANKYGTHWWYRHICAIGGVGNVLLMMTANLIGFVLGLDGTKYLIDQLTSTISGWLFMIFACSCLFIAVQVMFEYREEEKRKGIDRRC